MKYLLNYLLNYFINYLLKYFLNHSLNYLHALKLAFTNNIHIVKLNFIKLFIKLY